MTAPTILPSVSPMRRHSRGPKLSGTVVAAVVIALFVAGGAYQLLTRSSDATTPVAARALTHAQLVIAAERVCKAMNTKQQAAGRARPAGAAYLDTSVIISRRAVSRLHRLVPPVTDQAAYSKALAGADKLTTRLAAGSAALRAGKTAPAQKLLREAQKATASVNAQFVKLGMPTCGS